MEEKTKMDAYIPICEPCYDFTVDGIQRERRTVIIAPITTQDLDSNVRQIGWVCSRGRYCADSECHYAKKKTNTDDFRPVETIGHLDR